MQIVTFRQNYRLRAVVSRDIHSGRVVYHAKYRGADNFWVWCERQWEVVRALDGVRIAYKTEVDAVKAARPQPSKIRVNQKRRKLPRRVRG